MGRCLVDRHRQASGNRTRPTSVGRGDGWTRVTAERSELGHRYLEVMRQLNPETYSPNDPARYVKRMWRPPNAYYHLDGVTYEIVVGFDWARRLRRFRIISTGFVGDISPSQALDRVVEKAREFSIQNNLHHLFAIRPRRMESARILEFYDLLNLHPDLRIRGGHWLSEGEYLWIRFSSAV